MVKIKRTALTYQEEIIIEVEDSYQTYWIPHEQYEIQKELYELPWEIEQELKYLLKAKKRSYLSKPEKDVNSGYCNWSNW